MFCCSQSPEDHRGYQYVFEALQRDTIHYTSGGVKHTLFGIGGDTLLLLHIAASVQLVSCACVNNRVRLCDQQELRQLPLFYTQYVPGPGVPSLLLLPMRCAYNNTSHNMLAIDSESIDLEYTKLGNNLRLLNEMTHACMPSHCSTYSDSMHLQPACNTVTRISVLTLL